MIYPAELAEHLRSLDIDRLPISQYSRDALRRVVAHYDYYFEIYRRCVEYAIINCEKTPCQLTIVDYGGGHGLFALTAKTMGFAKVIYVDHNPDAVNTVRTLSDRTGVPLDAILCGDTDSLGHWCTENHITPDTLIAVDVIEHIYNLDTFFFALHQSFPSMAMVFTTASTPFNPVVKRRLHRAMVKDELRGDHSFFRQRRDHLKNLNPTLSDDELDFWASNTRGLTLDDAATAFSENRPNRLDDPYNTCDPVSGSWTERILPLDHYKRILQPLGYRMNIVPGFYNTHRSSAKGRVSRCINKLLNLEDVSSKSVDEKFPFPFRFQLFVAPFILFNVTPSKS